MYESPNINKTIELNSRDRVRDEEASKSGGMAYMQTN
jgi:hypothetical protein